MPHTMVGGCPHAAIPKPLSLGGGKHLAVSKLKATHPSYFTSLEKINYS